MHTVTCNFCGEPIPSIRGDRQFCGSRCSDAKRLQKASIWHKHLRGNRYHCPECIKHFRQSHEWIRHLLEEHQQVVQGNSLVGLWDADERQHSEYVWQRIMLERRKHEREGLPAAQIARIPPRGKQPKIQREVFDEVEWTHPEFWERVMAWRRERGL